MSAPDLMPIIEALRDIHVALCYVAGAIIGLSFAVLAAHWVKP